MQLRKYKVRYERKENGGDEIDLDAEDIEDDMDDDDDSKSSASSSSSSSYSEGDGGELTLEGADPGPASNRRLRDVPLGSGRSGRGDGRHVDRPLIIPAGAARRVRGPTRRAGNNDDGADDDLLPTEEELLELKRDRDNIQIDVLFPGDEETSSRRADVSLTNRGDAAAATRIFRGYEFAATPRPRRGRSAETSRGDAAAATWTFRGDESRRGCDVDILRR